MFLENGRWREAVAFLGKLVLQRGQSISCRVTPTNVIDHEACPLQKYVTVSFSRTSSVVTSRGEHRPLTLETIIIEPGRYERNYWYDLWRYRELFRVLAWRDLAVRYKQTVIGVAWAVIRPFLTMLVFTIIFGRIAKFPSEGTVPYPLTATGSWLLWIF
jgi:hypothetical protein